MYSGDPLFIAQEKFYESVGFELHLIHICVLVL